MWFLYTCSCPQTKQAVSKSLLAGKRYEGLGVAVWQDPETYIHRSGRTGRAGRTGVSVTLVDRKKEGLIPFIQRRAGVAFERIGAPQPAEMARIAGV